MSKAIGNQADLIYLNTTPLNGDLLTNDHGILYILPFYNGEFKAGQSTKNLAGFTPAAAFEKRYKDRSQSNSDTVAKTIIVFNKVAGRSIYDNNIRELCHELYTKGEIPFGAVCRSAGKTSEGNTESLINYIHDEHVGILVDVIKQYFGLCNFYDTKRPIIFRNGQEEVIEETVAVLKKEKSCLLAAFTSFGKTILALETIARLIPNGGVVLVTTPIVETMRSMHENVKNYHFGSNRSTLMSFMDSAEFEKHSIDSILSRKNNGEIIIIGISVQNLRYDDLCNNDDQIRDKFSRLSNNIDVWVRDERHFQYEGYVTSRKLVNLSSNYLLDLTATPYNVLDQYKPSQIISRTLSWAVINQPITEIPNISIEVINTPFCNVNPALADSYSLEEGFAPQKLFNMVNNNFVYLSEILTLTRLFYNDSNSKKKNPLSVINDTNLSYVSKKCGMWFLPTGIDSVSSTVYIDELYKVLNNQQQHTFFISSYEVERTCPYGCTIGDYVEQLLAIHDRVIILTCRKFITGTDIPALGHIIMFDKLQSVAGFEQLLGRTIRKYPNKNSVKIYSLAPSYSTILCIGLMAKMNQTVGGGCSYKLVESIPISAYDSAGSIKVFSSSEVFEITHQWCEDQVRSKLPSYIIKRGLNNSDLSRWDEIDINSFSVKNPTLVQKLSDDTEAKIKERINLPGNKVVNNSIVDNSIVDKIEQLIQSIVVESQWISYTSKCYDYEIVFQSPQMINMFSKEIMDVIIYHIDNDNDLRQIIMTDFANKKLAYELLSIRDVCPFIFENSVAKQQNGLVYVDFNLSDQLVNEISCIANKDCFVVVNALNGSIPVSIKEQYPHARIVCAEEFSYFKEHLTGLGFEVIDYSDLESFIKEYKMIEQKDVDVLISNPPYQMNDNGFKASATPIYNKFIDHAKLLKPRHILMVVPSRFLTGGKGLDSFRKEMLNDDRIRLIHDFHNSKHFFPNVEIKGGVCYFRWDRDSRGDCKVIEHYSNGVTSEMTRPLLEHSADVFIRYNEAIPIFHKIRALKEDTIDSMMTLRSVFGFPTSYKAESASPFNDSVKFFGQKSIGYIDKNRVTKNIEWLDKHIVIAPEAIGSGDSLKDVVKPIYAGPDTCFSLTYLPLGVFETKDECLNFMSYVETKFFHFLLTLKKNTQHTTQKEYAFIPMQDFTKPWADDELFKKYNLSDDEIKFIIGIVR